MKNKVKSIIIIVVLILVACFIPFQESGVNLSLYFDADSSEMNEERMSEFQAYYSTAESPVISSDKTVDGIYDKENSKVSFKFDSDYTADITEIRIDFPAAEQLLFINGISISSGGGVKKNPDPSRFLTKDNISYMNDILGFNTLEPSCNSVIRTGSDDPYIILSRAVTEYIVKQQSKHIASRIGILAILLCCFAAYSKIEWQDHK